MNTTRLTSQLRIELPIVQAPMSGAQCADLAAAVSGAGALGSLPCGLLGPEQIRAEVDALRARTSKPFNLNFFCHQAPGDVDLRAWRARLAPYYDELRAEVPPPSSPLRPFGDEQCAVVEEVRPEVVSFHFGLPPEHLLARVRATGAKVLATATTVDEARWLAARGCDAIIAQGLEAGGHRGMFLSDDVTTQVGTLALVPQVVDAVQVPVIAAGGIMDARGIVAAFALGAAGVQLGTAYLACVEAKLSSLHRAALAQARDNGTAVTSAFSGKAARCVVNRFVREVGPAAREAPPFPWPLAVVGPLRAKAEAAGSSDFSPLWIGQGAPLARAMPAATLTTTLWSEVTARRRAWA